MPNPDLEAEKLTAYEIGYRALLTNRLSLDIAAFSNRHSDQSQWNIGTAQLATTPVMHLSMHRWHTSTPKPRPRREGIEISNADWRPLDWMRLEASHTWLRVTAPAPDGVNTYVAGTSPTPVRAALDNGPEREDPVRLLAAPRRQVAVAGSGNPGLYGTRHPPRRAVNKNLDLSLVGQNLLDSRHAEFSETSIIPVSYIPRSVYAKATWKF